MISFSRENGFISREVSFISRDIKTVSRETEVISRETVLITCEDFSQFTVFAVGGREGSVKCPYGISGIPG
jgi:hypothetical protein